MQKLITLLAVVLAGALAAVLFFWRRSEGSWSSMWSSAEDSNSTWSDAASHEVGKAVDSVRTAADRAPTEASHLAEQLSGDATRTATKIGEVADNVADAASDAGNSGSSIVEEPGKGGT